MSIKVILFDIGGVLVELAVTKKLSELIKDEITLERYAISKYIRLYESGQCDTKEFAGGLIEELGLAITPENFIDDFSSFVKGFFPGAPELLRHLKPKYTLACLSNTNAIHWDGLRERISIDGYFHHVFLSYEIGKLKPQLDFYTYAIDRLGCVPQEIAFFDDSEANVKAGVAAGMNAYRVVDFEDLKDKLKTLDLL
ncbi:MAG: HAD family phosphatase [Defluviitaleaceae bacterium]|nr:HAD family phosphatase [Defluviitaleaceae bacterium]